MDCPPRSSDRRAKSKRLMARNCWLPSCGFSTLPPMRRKKPSAASGRNLSDSSAQPMKSSTPTGLLPSASLSSTLPRASARLTPSAMKPSASSARPCRPHRAVIPETRSRSSRTAAKAAACASVAESPAGRAGAGMPGTGEHCRDGTVFGMIHWPPVVPSVFSPSRCVAESALRKANASSSVASPDNPSLISASLSFLFMSSPSLSFLAEVFGSAPRLTNEHSRTFDSFQMLSGPFSSRPFTMTEAPASMRSTRTGQTPTEHCHGCPSSQRPRISLASGVVSENSPRMWKPASSTLHEVALPTILSRWCSRRMGNEASAPMPDSSMTKSSQNWVIRAPV